MMMSSENGVRMSYGNMLTTIALAVAGFWFIADVSKATESNASEIEHQKELAKQDRENIKEDLKEIKELLRQIAEE